MATSMVVPERSLEQRREALQKANEIRFARAKLKKDITAGKVKAIDIIMDPPTYVGTMHVIDLLLAMRGYGRTKVNKVLFMARISPHKTVGGLSSRQRLELASRLSK